MKGSLLQANGCCNQVVSCFIFKGSLICLHILPSCGGGGLGSLHLVDRQDSRGAGSRALVANPASSSCVTKAKLYSLSRPQSPHVYNGIDESSRFIGPWGGEFIGVKC